MSGADHATDRAPDGPSEEPPRGPPHGPPNGLPSRPTPGAGRCPLADRVVGHHAANKGAMTLDEVRSLYAAEPAGPFGHRSLLVRLPHASDHPTGAAALFEATRGPWRLGPDREAVELAMAVHEGIVREVYEVTGWRSVGTRAGAAGDAGSPDPGRWELEGRVCPDAAVRDRYRSRSVEAYFPHASPDPVRHVWPDVGSVDEAA